MYVIFMKKALSKGFTLIELLVVIAIIGILASVILASLDSARAKGTDAATESDLDNSRAQAEIFYDGNNNSYGAGATSVCVIPEPGTPPTGGGINTMIADAATKFNGGTPVINGAIETATTVNCNSGLNAANLSAWAAETPLKAQTGKYFCVDSTGAAKVVVTPLPASGTTGVVCPAS
jgi:prepilin-type N-terminal cleavage/methylation domain-containing protein